MAAGDEDATTTDLTAENAKPQSDCGESVGSAADSVLNQEQNGGGETFDKKKKKRRKRKFKLFSNSFISQFFLVWIYQLIWIARDAGNLRNLILVLRPSETAQDAGERLEKHWKEQLKLYSQLM
jgi:hypothetical protein